MAPITPNPMAQEEAILMNSVVGDGCTFAIGLLAPHQEHLTLLREGLQIGEVLVDFAGHARINYSENVLSWHLKSQLE